MSILASDRVALVIGLSCWEKRVHWYFLWQMRGDYDAQTTYTKSYE